MTDRQESHTYLITLSELRALLESEWAPTVHLYSNDELEFRIEALEGGSQRDPETVGIRAIWYTSYQSNAKEEG